MDREQIKKELHDLIIEGRDIQNLILSKRDPSKIADNEKNRKFLIVLNKKFETPERAYHSWYDRAYEWVRKLSPRSLKEFEEHYTGDKHAQQTKGLNYMTAGTTHYIQQRAIILNGHRIDFYDNFNIGMNEQKFILIRIYDNFNDRIFNLENDIHNSVYESELDIAKDIQEQGYLKIAGAVAGVIIEAHLKTLVAKKDLPIKTEKNKSPTMDDYNTALKKDKTYGTATWRLIQRCGDIRNDCTHSNEDKPTKKETDDIIRAAEQIIADYN